MKKIVLVLVLVSVIAGGLFAESDGEEREKKFTCDLLLETAYPIIWENGSATTQEYLVSYAMLRLSSQLTIVSTSDYLNLGLGVDLFQNPLSLMNSLTFGGIGVSLYNDFFFGNFIMAPYLKSNIILTAGESSTNKAYLESFVDISVGFSFSIYNVLLDVAYYTPIIDITDDAEDFHFNAHAIRIGLGYRI